MTTISSAPQIDPEIIKTFLKVRTPQASDKNYYEIDPSNQIFTLYDPIIKAPSQKSLIFETDKIFTEKNENSYIYEEICRDCISESLNHTNFLYIGYGIASSDKQNILIGNPIDCTTNINNRGLLPRLLGQYLETISSKEHSDLNLSISMSYMCVNSNKVIDLSNYMGKDISSLTEISIINSGIEIKPGSKDTISSIKKVPTENSNDVIFFINKILGTFFKLDPNSTYHLFSWSHFAFVIYINDNNGNIISTITFIMLCGNEQANSQGEGDIKQQSKASTRTLIKKSKNMVNAQFTYDSIINAILMNNDLNQGHKISNSDEEKEKLDFSKLTQLLYSICFSAFVSNMKYRIIGSVSPNTGFYNSVKDTLMFLFQIKKIVRKKDALQHSETITTLANEKSTDNQKGNRDDLIYDLESKLKTQEKTIFELNERIEGKDNKIKILEENYKKQIETLKVHLGFEGDVNVLLSGNQYTKEAKFARGIREAVDNLRIRNKHVAELEEKVKELKEQIKKMKTQNEIRENDRTMVMLFNNVKENKGNIEKELKLSNEVSETMGKLQGKISSLEKINEELRNDVKEKNKLLLNLPNVLQNKADEHFTLSQVKENTVKQCDMKLKKEIENFQKQNNQEIKIMKDKYENLIKQKDTSITGLNNAYSQLKMNYDFEVKTYSQELIKLDEMLMHLVKSFKFLMDKKKNTTFATFLNSKDEYENILISTANEINNINFPLLYKKLLLQNKLEINNFEKKIIKRPCSASTKRISTSKTASLTETELNFGTIKPKVKQENNKNIETQKEKGELIYLYEKNQKLEKLIKEQVEINNNNKIVINSLERSIEKLKAENLILQNKLYSKEKNDQISYPIFTNNQSCNFFTSDGTNSNDYNIPTTKSMNKLSTTISNKNNTFGISKKTKRTRPLTAK